MFCTNCGHELAPEAKFCSNCGAPVDAGAPSEPPFETPAERRERERREDFAKAWGSAASTPPPSADDVSSANDATPNEAEAHASDTSEGGFSTRSATWELERAKLRSGDPEDEWSMSDLGPAKPQRKRIWLWVVLGLVAAAVIACCVFGWWLVGTDSGKEFIDNIELQLTQTAEALERATEVPATPQP